MPPKRPASSSSSSSSSSKASAPSTLVMVNDAPASEQDAPRKLVRDEQHQPSTAAVPSNDDDQPAKPRQLSGFVYPIEEDEDHPNEEYPLRVRAANGTTLSLEQVLKALECTQLASTPLSNRPDYIAVYDLHKQSRENVDFNYAILIKHGLELRGPVMICRASMLPLKEVTRQTVPIGSCQPMTLVEQTLTTDTELDEGKRAERGTPRVGQLYLTDSATSREVLPADKKHFQLKELYSMLTCQNVEIVRLPSKRGFVAVIDEEGRVRHRALNMQVLQQYQMELYGPVLICRQGMIQ